MSAAPHARIHPSCHAACRRCPAAAPPLTQPARRVLVLGATGTIGCAAVQALLQRGHQVLCLVRPQAGVGGTLAAADSARLLISPRQQGEPLFALPGKPARFKHVPVALLDGRITVLALAGRLVPALAAKAELARIGRYHATESMLVLNPATGLYDAAATPSAGSQTLFDFYAAQLRGAVAPERGDHAVF